MSECLHQSFCRPPSYLKRHFFWEGNKTWIQLAFAWHFDKRVSNAINVHPWFSCRILVLKGRKVWSQMCGRKSQVGSHATSSCGIAKVPCAAPCRPCHKTRAAPCQRVRRPCRLRAVRSACHLTMWHPLPSSALTYPENLWIGNKKKCPLTFTLSQFYGMKRTRHLYKL